MTPGVSAGASSSSGRGSPTNSGKKAAGAWVDAKGQKLVADQKYRVATLDYLYFGGDGFEIEPHDTGPNFTGMGWQTTVIDWTKKLGTTEQAPLEAALKKR